jgi:hypothetical protein
VTIRNWLPKSAVALPRRNRRQDERAERIASLTTGAARGAGVCRRSLPPLVTTLMRRSDALAEIPSRRGSIAA